MIVPEVWCKVWWNNLFVFSALDQSMNCKVEQWRAKWQNRSFGNPILISGWNVCKTSRMKYYSNVISDSDLYKLLQNCFTVAALHPRLICCHSAHWGFLTIFSNICEILIIHTTILLNHEPIDINALFFFWYILGESRLLQFIV